MNLEAIYVALWSQISANLPASVITKARRWQHYDDVPQAAQPAVFLWEGPIEVQRVRGMPAIYAIHPELYVYCNNKGDNTIAPGTLLNPIINAVISALEPTGPDDTQTLGGLVDRAYIDGSIEVDGGHLGEQSVAIIPLFVAFPA